MTTPEIILLVITLALTCALTVLLWKRTKYRHHIAALEATNQRQADQMRRLTNARDHAVARADRLAPDAEEMRRTREQRKANLAKGKGRKSQAVAN